MKKVLRWLWFCVQVIFIFIISYPTNFKSDCRERLD